VNSVISPKAETFYWLTITIPRRSVRLLAIGRRMM
jgi:hypothetical protein